MYESQIKSLELEFENLSKKLHEMKLSKTDKTPEFDTANTKRSGIFDEIRRLRRLQWDMDHEQLDWDE